MSAEGDFRCQRSSSASFAYIFRLKFPNFLRDHTVICFEHHFTLFATSCPPICVHDLFTTSLHSGSDNQNVSNQKNWPPLRWVWSTISCIKIGQWSDEYMGKWRAFTPGKSSCQFNVAFLVESVLHACLFKKRNGTKIRILDLFLL